MGIIVSMRDLVLVVEDEPDLRATIELNLRRAGYRTMGAERGREALELASSAPPALVMLDLNLPDISGFEVCRQLRAIRETGTVPVLVLTARDDEVDRVVALEIGADDYVTKPFSLRELLLRVDALLRRSIPVASNGNQETTDLSAGDIELDLGRRVCTVFGTSIHLSNTEFELLRTLMEREGRVQSRERLLADVWNNSVGGGGRTVDTHVKRLRQKLGEAGGQIRTVRGVGYCMSNARSA
jgi:two-component system phosphate regulon response regulator PhoB